MTDALISVAILAFMAGFIGLAYLVGSDKNATEYHPWDRYWLPTYALLVCVIWWFR